VELRGDEARLAWLSRKAAQHGFELINVRIATGVPNTVAHSHRKIVGMRAHMSGRNAVTLATSLFEGELRITDAERFRKALFGGIGPARAYGCGLLSVAPAR